MLSPSTLRGHSKLIFIGGLCGLASCNAGDWRASAIAHAEDLVRVEVNDPTARFTNEQVTGDSSTGQTCGFVRVKGGATTLSKVGRFIVYIDGGAGPFVEAGMSPRALSREDFDFQWQNDCLNEGYKS